MVTKYYSVEPKEKSLALYSPSDKGLTLDFDIFGFNGIGYEQKLDIYDTYKTTKNLYWSLDAKTKRSIIYSFYRFVR